jgi:DNA adenine methylase
MNNILVGKTNKTLVPPLKCQGIKTKLIPWIREVVGESFNRWIEPFMGSGVVGFNMSPQVAVLADSNPHIINFYRAIQSGEITPESAKIYLKQEGELLRTATDQGYAHYRLVRDRFNESGHPLDFLFLSRAGFNGMMRFSQQGRWNIPFCKKPERFAPAYITKIVNQIAGVAQCIQPEWVFLHQDYLTTLTSAQADDMIYCDPPYLGRYTGYFNTWKEEDEACLAAALSSTPARFVLSSWHHNDFRENTALAKYWSQFNILTRDHFYHNGAREENRRAIVEALICNFDLQGFNAHNHDSLNKPNAAALSP